MLKRIKTGQLRNGMYIQKLCCTWMDHPFWRPSFTLEKDSDLREIRDNGISEVWIDTSRGLDVLHEEDVEEYAIGPEESDAQSAEEPVQPCPAPAESELARATRLCATAKSAVSNMFQEVRMGRAIDVEHALPLVEEISASVLENPGTLISLARLKTKDDYTYMHSVAVCALMVSLGRELGLGRDQIQQAGLGGLLHDIGKSGVPLDVLNKPGKLTNEEFHLVKAHPEIGHRLMSEGGQVGEIPLDICLHHHEKTNGTGYPHRLGDSQISLFAKMAAVCDVYDAITSNRPYKAGWDPSDSLRKMAEWCDGHFDERIFHAFVKSVGIYPIGSLVRLESGRLGVVVSQAGGSLLTPSIRVFFCTRTGGHITPALVDLSQAGCQDRVEAQESPARWNFGDLSPLWAGDAFGPQLAP